MHGHSERIMRVATAIAASLYFAFIAAGAAAAETLTPKFIAVNGDAVVTRILYEGNKRTHDSALAELTGIRVGMRLSEIDPEAVKQSVLKSGIFSAVDLAAQVDGAKAVLTVTVKEKWTLIPVPSATFGSDEWSAGLTVVDYNFLGLRKTLVLNGKDSNLGLGGLIAYTDPRFLHSRASFSAFVQGGRATRLAEYADGTSYASFAETTAAGGMSVTYPSEGKLNAEADLTLRYSGVDAEAASSYGLRENLLRLIPAAAVNYDDRSVVGYRKAGTLASLSYTHDFGLEGSPSYDMVACTGETDIGIFWGGYLETGLAAYYGTRSFQALGALSGSGYRLLPQDYSYSAKSAAGFVNLMLPVVRAGWSVMEIGPFYEGGVYATGLAEDNTSVFHGPGFGYRLYLRNIALPAIEIDAAYDLPIENFVFSVNIGLSL